MSSDVQNRKIDPQLDRLKVDAESQKSKLIETTRQSKTLLNGIGSELSDTTTQWSTEVSKFNENLSLTHGDSALSNFLSELDRTKIVLFKISEYTSWIFFGLGGLFLIFLVGSFIAGFDGILAYLAISGVASFAAGLILDDQVGKRPIQWWNNAKSTLIAPIFQSSGELKTSIRKFKEDLARITVLSKALESSIDSVASTSENFALTNDNYYRMRDLRRKQQRFSREFRASLINFNISLNDKAIDFLENFRSDSISETDWLENISSNVSSKLGINQEILKLIFFDFVKDIEEMKKIWPLVKAKPALLNELCRILLTTEPREFADPIGTREFRAPTQMLESLGVFSSSDFRLLYQTFYLQLAQTKIVFIDTMSELNFDVKKEIIRTIIKRYVPPFTDNDSCTNEVFKKAAALLHCRMEIMGLLFYDKIGLQSQKENFWKQISENPEAEEVEQPTRNNLQDILVRELLNRKLVEVPTSYEGDREQIEQSIALILFKYCKNNFSLADFRRKVSDLFVDMDRKKDAMIRALEGANFNLPKDSRKRFEEYIPENGDFIFDLAKKIFEEIKDLKLAQVEIEPLFIELLFYKYMNNPLVHQSFQTIKTEGKLLSLASVMLEKKLVVMNSGKEFSKEAQNLSIILELENSYDLPRFQSSYLSKGRLYGVALDLEAFLKQEGLINNASFTSFKDVAYTLSDIENNNYLDQIKKVCLFMLTKTFLVQTKAGVTDAVILSAVCSFLAKQGDLAKPDACKQAASTTDLTKRYLYRHMELKESTTFRTTSEQTLAKAIEEVSNNQAPVPKFLMDFEIGLSWGILYGSTKELLQAKAHDVEEQSQIFLRLEEDIKKIRKNVKDFLNFSLPEDFLLYAIDAQLIQAYMVSMTTHDFPVMTDIMDIRMKQIAAQNKQYNDLLLFTEDKPTIGGYSTRVGIVPIGWDFDKFSQKFIEIFQNAVDDYLKENGLDKSLRSKFSLNLFRFFASPLTFKKVRGITLPSGQLDSAHPIHSVKKVIVDYLNSVDALKLVASSKPDKERTIILRKVIIDLFDSQADILLLIESEIGDILSSNKDMKAFFANRAMFNQELCAKFGVVSITKLGVSLSKITTDHGNKEAVTATMGALEKIFENHLIKIEHEQLNRVAISIERVLSNLGEVLQY